MRLSMLAATAATLAMASGATAQLGVIFTEDFDDGAAATRWSAPVVDAENGVFDGDVIYDFDYGAVGIPSAPGSGGSTTGILFEANTTDQGGAQGEAVAIVPTVGGELPATDYRYTVDVYFNVERQNGGSTEFGLFGVHAVEFNDAADQGLNDDVPFDFGVSNGNGLAWQASGDSGAFNDFNNFADPGNADAGTQTNLGSYDDRENLDPASFPSIADPINGAEGVWLEMEILRIGDVATFSLDGTLIDTFDASAFAAGSGTILLGYADFFNSVGVTTFEVGPDPTPFDDSDGPFGDSIAGFAHFVVFDNVTIEAIPEPTSAVLGAMALVGLAARRRR